MAEAFSPALRTTWGDITERGEILDGGGGYYRAKAFSPALRTTRGDIRERGVEENQREGGSETL